MVEREKNIPNIDLTDFIRNPDSESARQSCVEVPHFKVNVTNEILLDCQCPLRLRLFHHQRSSRERRAQ